METDYILVFGSVAYDYIMDFRGDLNDNLVSDKDQSKFNLAVMPHSKEIRFGGTSGNIAYNLAQLEAPTKIITAVGKDFGTLGYKIHLEQYSSIEFIGEIHQDMFTASCYIVNDKNFNQMIIFHEGAMSRCPQISFTKRNLSLKKIKIASISPDNYEAMVNWARDLSNLGIRFILDTGQVTPAFSGEILNELIPKAFLVIGNEFEIQMILDKMQLSLNEPLDLNSKLIITKGDSGSILYQDGEKTKFGICPPRKVEDTTGAGDAFRAGLLFGFLHDFSLVSSCKIGTTLSSFAVETLGPQTQKYTWKDVQTRYQKNFGESLNINFTNIS